MTRRDMAVLLQQAVAEKLSALKTEEYFAERAARGDVERAKKLLASAGVGNPPMPGDELPEKLRKKR